ncbi:hypothetical protein B0H13DRAFT_1852375 [Mycena leptocephala]|nr:hypothetical protein B0H13DRAFT_1852375 [Mycena leptocephala]
MRKGKFTAEQDAHLNTYIPELLQKLGASVRGVELTRWKQSIATKALGTSAFADLDVSTIPRTEWFKMIVRKYTNYFNNVYRKSHPEEPPASALIKNNPLLKFTSILNGRQLFARDFHDEIGAIAAQRVADTGINAAAAHQIALKEMWDALSAEEKSDWDSQAEDEAADVESNQKEFSTNIHLALRSLCQGGLLGDAEMVLFYGFRDTKNGDLLAGTPGSFHVTSVTVDEDGTVNFPSVDLDNTPVANIRVLLEDYLEKTVPFCRGDYDCSASTNAPASAPPPPPPAHNLEFLLHLHRCQRPLPVTVRLHLPRNHPGNLKVKIQRDPKSDPGNFLLGSRYTVQLTEPIPRDKTRNQESEKEKEGENKRQRLRKDTAGTGSSPVPDPPVRRSSRTAAPKPETSAKRVGLNLVTMMVNNRNGFDIAVFSDCFNIVCIHVKRSLTPFNRFK